MQSKPEILSVCVKSRVNGCERYMVEWKRKDQADTQTTNLLREGECSFGTTAQESPRHSRSSSPIYCHSMLLTFFHLNKHTASKPYYIHQSLPAEYQGILDILGFCLFLFKCCVCGIVTHLSEASPQNHAHVEVRGQPRASFLLV